MSIAAIEELGKFHVEWCSVTVSGSSMSWSDQRKDWTNVNTSHRSYADVWSPKTACPENLRDVVDVIPNQGVRESGDKPALLPIDKGT